MMNNGHLYRKHCYRRVYWQQCLGCMDCLSHFQYTGQSVMLGSLQCVENKICINLALGCSSKIEGKSLLLKSLHPLVTWVIGVESTMKASFPWFNFHGTRKHFASCQRKETINRPTQVQTYEQRWAPFIPVSLLLVFQYKVQAWNQIETNN